MRVVLREAYERRVDEELAYLIENGAYAAAQRLLNQAYDVLPDLLGKFPQIGRDFIGRNPATPQVQDAWEQARELLGDDMELREYILGDPVSFPRTSSHAAERAFSHATGARKPLAECRRWRLYQPSIQSTMSSRACARVS